MRIALANIRYAATPDESIARAEQAIEEAGARQATIICFPECYVPGYRGLGWTPPPPDTVFLERAWSRVGAAAARARIAVVLGTERIVNDTLAATVMVVNDDGTIAGFQDKARSTPARTGRIRRERIAECSRPGRSRLAS